MISLDNQSVANCLSLSANIGSSDIFEALLFLENHNAVGID